MQVICELAAIQVECDCIARHCFQRNWHGRVERVAVPGDVIGKAVPCCNDAAVSNRQHYFSVGVIGASVPGVTRECHTVLDLLQSIAIVLVVARPVGWTPLPTAARAHAAPYDVWKSPPPLLERRTWSRDGAVCREYVGRANATDMKAMALWPSAITSLSLGSDSALPPREAATWFQVASPQRSQSVGQVPHPRRARQCDSAKRALA